MNFCLYQSIHLGFPATFPGVHNSLFDRLPFFVSLFFILRVLPHEFVLEKIILAQSMYGIGRVFDLVDLDAGLASGTTYLCLKKQIKELLEEVRQTLAAKGFPDTGLNVWDKKQIRGLSQAEMHPYVRNQAWRGAASWKQL